MKIITDTKELYEDGRWDELGEEYRKTVFGSKDGLGCYQTFKVMDGFIPCTELPKWVTIIDSQFRTDLFNPALEGGIWAKFINDQLGLFVAWYWDGDGVLFCYEKDVGAVINYDCKKTNNWEPWEG